MGREQDYRLVEHSIRSRLFVILRVFSRGKHHGKRESDFHSILHYIHCTCCNYLYGEDIFKGNGCQGNVTEMVTIFESLPSLGDDEERSYVINERFVSKFFKRKIDLQENISK